MSLIAYDETVNSKGILSGPIESRDLPDWFREQQRDAWEKFESIPRPTRKDQAWRFSNVDLLDLAQFGVMNARSTTAATAAANSSSTLSDDDRARTSTLKHSARLIFAGDQLIERNVVSDDLKKLGVIFQPLERAMIEHADLFRKYFMSQPAVLGSAKFAALHKALVYIFLIKRVKCSSHVHTRPSFPTSFPSVGSLF